MLYNSPRVNLASASIGSIPMPTLLITALPIIAFIRYLNVLLNDYVIKEKPMSKLFRHVVLYASCFIETFWAMVVSVVAGLMTGGVQIILALAKSSQFLIFLFKALTPRNII